VRLQRSRKDMLAPERRSLLEALPKWTWDPYIDQWNYGFQQLKTFIARTGSASPFQSHNSQDGFALGRWVSRQRVNKDSLSLERKRLLEALPKWSWEQRDDNWNVGFAALQEYVSKSGDARPPRDHQTKDGFRLGNWISNLRVCKSTQSLERKRLLEALPKWSWDPYSDQWTDGIEKLKAYVRKNGDARPPAKYKSEDGFRLGYWVCNLRGRKDSTPPDRIKYLESFKGWSWDILGDRWAEGFARLKEYVKISGAAKPLQTLKTKDGYPLGIWVSTQRSNKDKLAKEQKQLLEYLPGWVWVASQKKK